MKDDYEFCWSNDGCFNVLFSEYKQHFLFFFLKITIIYNNLVDYNFINRDETFIFLLARSLQNSETPIEYSYFHGKIIVCMGLITICSPC